MKFKSLVLASVLAFAGSAAIADSSSAFGVNGTASFSSGSFAGSGSFTDIISFTGLDSGTYKIIGDISGTDVSFTNVALDGNPWTTFDVGQFSFGYLKVTANTPMTMVITGIAYDAPHFNGSVHVTAVPEPSTIAMLLAGLGLMGTVSRRRKIRGTN